MKAADIREQNKHLLERPYLSELQVFKVAAAAGNKVYDFLYPPLGTSLPVQYPFDEEGTSENRNDRLISFLHLERTWFSKPDVLYRVDRGGEISDATPAVRAAYAAFSNIYPHLRRSAEHDASIKRNLEQLIVEAEARERDAKSHPIVKQLRALKDKITRKKQAREQPAKAKPKKKR
jgi:hypothetical protein